MNIENLLDRGSVYDDDFVSTRFMAFALDLLKIKVLRSIDSNFVALLINACHFGTTSQAKDEVHCLRVLLRLDLSPVLSSHPYGASAPWIRFLQDQCFFPRNIVFMDGERVPFPPYRGAPSSFLDRPLRSTRNFGQDKCLGMATSAGFLFISPGVIIDPSHDRRLLRYSKLSISHPESEKWYLVLMREPVKDFRSRSQVLREARWAERLAIILEFPITDEANIHNSPGVLAAMNTPTVIGPDGRSITDCIAVEYLTCVDVFDGQKFQDRFGVSNFSKIEDSIGGEGRPCIRADRSHGKDQVWCLS